MDTYAYISPEGRTMAPVRYLGNALGAQTSWDAATQTVTITKGGTTIVMTIGIPKISVNGATSDLDVAPVIKDGRTFLPVRWVANALGAKVQYDSYTYQVIISVDGFSDFPPALVKTSN